MGIENINNGKTAGVKTSGDTRYGLGMRHAF